MSICGSRWAEKSFWNVFSGLYQYSACSMMHVAIGLPCIDPSSGLLSLALLYVRLFSFEHSSRRESAQLETLELGIGASMSIVSKCWCGSGHGLVDVRDGEQRKDDVDVDGETCRERLRLRPIVYDSVIYRADGGMDVGGDTGISGKLGEQK